MAREKRNVVQAEFFLVNTDPRRTLESVEAESRARIKMGTNVKEGVRFYDSDGSITRLICAAKEAHERSHQILMNFPVKGSNFAQHISEWRRRSANKSHDRKKEQALRLTIQRLQEIARTTKEIAIERGAHEFTMARPNELHELIESICRSRGVWFFVFKPNALTADKNEPIAHTM